MKDKNIKPIKTGGIKPAPPQLTEEPLKSDCTGEIQQEYNNVGFFKKLWRRLKGLFN